MNTIFLGYGNGKKILIAGVNIYNFKWDTTGECITVINPENKKGYTFTVYSCSVGNENIKFACGYFENNKDVFYKINN